MSGHFNYLELEKKYNELKKKYDESLIQYIKLEGKYYNLLDENMRLQQELKS